MAIEIRVLSGALAGQTKRYEQAVIVVGRQAGLDLRFDPQQDLDVSGRHAEIRATNDGYEIHDSGSTNGTYVNGKKVSGSATLSDGDKIKFGAKGPETECHVTAHGMEPDIRRTPARSTEQRIAIAVTQQTAGLKRAMIAAGLLVVVGGGAALYYMRAQSAKRTEEFNKLIADNEAMRVQIGTRMGDTTLANEIQLKMASLQKRLEAATTDTERNQIKAEMQENGRQLRRMAQMDMATIFKQNSPAVAFLITEIDGKSYSGTGFSISKDGHILTNKHNVLVDGKTATRIAVKMTDTRRWLPASLVKMSETDDDVALIKMDRADEGPFPFVSGISSTSADATEGMSLVAIGYPSGTDLPMEGEGKDFIAKSSLNPATASKRTSAVLQIDSYATHGSSGSPVFSARGLVVGLIYGGAREAGGKIVYAVPAEKIAAFIPAELRGIVKD